MKGPIITGILSFVVLALVVILGDAFGAGSAFTLGLSHALFFGTFAAVFFFPVLVALGFFVRWFYEQVFLRKMPLRSVMPWFTPGLAGILLLVVVAMEPRTPEALYQRHVSDDVPSSLSDFRHWHVSGYGNHRSLISFRINPSEFEKVLKRYAFTRSNDPEGFLPLEFSRPVPPDFPIRLPVSPLVEVYHYSEPPLGKPGKPFGVTVYTTKEHDFVIVRSSFN